MDTLVCCDEWIRDMERQHDDAGCQGALTPRVTSKDGETSLSLRCDRCGEMFDSPGAAAYFDA